MAADPRVTQVSVPALGEAADGVLSRWNRKVGDSVIANETLALIQLASQLVEVPSPASGVLSRIDRREGERVRRGESLAAVDIGGRATRLMVVDPVAAKTTPELPAIADPAEVEAPYVPPARAQVAGGRTLSRKLAGFGTTIFTEMTRLALEHKAINLAQGFPDFDGPELVKEAAIAAIRAGRAQYARMTGLPELHAALAARYKSLYGLEYAEGEEITVTSGATEAVFATLQGLCDVGDEVILFEPYYDSYKASVCMAGAIPRIVTLRGPDWSFDRDELARAFSPRTRAILVNTPHNPTGKVFSARELKQIARLCCEHDVLCITDEVYEHLVFSGTHLAMASLPGMRDRTLTISSLGKTFSLTGWKIGWVMAAAPLSAAVRAAHQFITFATATPLQVAAVAALGAPPSYFTELTASYRRRRDLLVEGLARVGFGVTAPAGTYFVCADIRPLGFTDDVAFCRMLTEKIGVAAIPPSVFYDVSREGKSYVRFAFCKKEETLREAVSRLEKLKRVG